MSRIDLPDLTLIAATSINVDATLRAIEASQSRIRFGACKLLTHHVPPRSLPGLEVVKIPKIETSAAYSQFLLRDLGDHVETSHCLVVQWDGYVIRPNRWDDRFLEYDYIGASWPQFTDGHDVGNGGFSLRSRHLLDACRSEQFKDSHPEDVAIGRHNRRWLEARGLRFASRDVADNFSAERAGTLGNALGFHGVWHMQKLLGPDRFWEVYRGLEDRTSVYHDQAAIMTELAKHPQGLRRCLKLLWDKLRETS